MAQVKSGPRGATRTARLDSRRQVSLNLIVNTASEYRVLTADKWEATALSPTSPAIGREGEDGGAMLSDFAEQIVAELNANERQG